MEKILKLKISTKVMLPYLLIIIPVIMILAVTQIFAVRGTMTEELKQKTYIMMSNLSESSSDPLFLGQNDVLDRILTTAEESNKDVIYAMVLNNKGLVVASTIQKYKDTYLDKTGYEKDIINNLKDYRMKKIDNYYEAASPIYVGETRKGFLRVGISLENINSTINRILLNTIITLIVALLYGVFIFLIMRQISGSMKTVLSGFEEISKGNLSKKIQIDTKDEIGKVASGFNDMAEKLEYSFHKIERQNEQIVEYNMHLEEIVAERTEELQKKNQQLLDDLKMAQKVQLGIIPDEKTLPKIKEIKFGSKYIALESIGGDLYDVIKIDDDRYGFLIADVSGHGVSAALISSMVKVSFQSKSLIYSNTEDICREVNNEICNLIGDLEYDLTAFFGIIDIKKRTIEFTNAAHHPAIIYKSKENKLVELQELNGYIGLMNDLKFTSAKSIIEEGDKIILFTDGIIEATNTNNDLYDVDRFKDFIKEHGKLPVKTFVNKFIDDLNEFCGQQALNDDVALLCFDFISEN